MNHRVLALLALLVLAAAVAAAATSPARAANPTDRKVALLTKQVTALGKQVKALTTQVTTLKKQQAVSTQAIGALATVTICDIAATADAVSGTWGIVDTITPGKTYFGIQPILDDAGACAAFQITRSQALPPTLATFDALLKLFASPSPLSAFEPR